jgi:hypothetical protein
MAALSQSISDMTAIRLMTLFAVGGILVDCAELLRSSRLYVSGGMFSWEVSRHGALFELQTIGILPDRSPCNPGSILYPERYGRQ